MGIWTPNIMFGKSDQTEILPFVGKNKDDYEIWRNLKNDNSSFEIRSYFYVESTIHCDFELHDYPFDDHECDLDFGTPEYSPKLINMGKIQILTNDSKLKPLEGEESIENDHLPFEFSIIPKGKFTQRNIYYSSSFTGVIIRAKRNNLGLLIGSFYVPTLAFSILSTISFFINPDIVCHFIIQGDPIQNF